MSWLCFFGIQAAHSLDVHVGEAGEAATFGECPTIVQAKSVWKSSEMWWARFVVMGCLVILVTRHAAGLLIHQKAFLRVCRSPRRHPNEGARSGLRARLNQWLQDVFFRPSTVSVVSDQSLYRWAAYDRLLVAFANFKGSWGFQSKRREGESRSPVEGFDFYRFSQSTLKVFSFCRSTNDFRTLSQKLNIFHIIQIVSFVCNFYYQKLIQRQSWQTICIAIVLVARWCLLTDSDGPNAIVTT